MTILNFYAIQTHCPQTMVTFLTHKQHLLLCFRVGMRRQHTYIHLRLSILPQIMVTFSIY